VALRPLQRRLNTLTDGHSLGRILTPVLVYAYGWVSIPSQMGTLLGEPLQTWARALPERLFLGVALHLLGLRILYSMLDIPSEATILGLGTTLRDWWYISPQNRPSVRQSDHQAPFRYQK